MQLLELRAGAIVVEILAVWLAVVLFGSGEGAARFTQGLPLGAVAWTNGGNTEPRVDVLDGCEGDTTVERRNSCVSMQHHSKDAAIFYLLPKASRDDNATWRSGLQLIQRESIQVKVFRHFEETIDALEVWCLQLSQIMVAVNDKIAVNGGQTRHQNMLQARSHLVGFGEGDAAAHVSQLREIHRYRIRVMVLERASNALQGAGYHFVPVVRGQGACDLLHAFQLDC